MYFHFLLIAQCALLWSFVASEQSIGKRLNHKFSTAPSGLPMRKVKLMGSEMHLRQLFIEPLRMASSNTTDNGIKKTIASITPQHQHQLGCHLFDRRRRKRQGCSGCGGCGGGGCGCGGGNGCGCGGNECRGGNNCCGRGCPSAGPSYSRQPLPALSSPPQSAPSYSAPSIPAASYPSVPIPSSPKQNPAAPLRISAAASDKEFSLSSAQLSQLAPGTTLALTPTGPGGSLAYQIIPPPGHKAAPTWQRQGEVSPSEKASESDQEYSAEEAAMADDLAPSQSAPLPPKKSYDQKFYTTGQQRDSFTGYVPPPPPPPPPVTTYARPPPKPAPRPPAYVKTKSPFPLPECYIDSSNFMCCNAQLEETINNAVDSLFNANPNFHHCNVQTIATTVQKFAERRFNTSFEAVVGLGDYASKSHFFHNYICKIEKENRYIMAYATPRWDLEGLEEEPRLPPPPPQPKGYAISPNPQYPQRPTRRIWSNYIYRL